MKEKSLYAGVLCDTAGIHLMIIPFSAGDYLIIQSLYRFLKVFQGQLNPVVKPIPSIMHRATMRNHDHRCRLVQWLSTSDGNQPLVKLLNEAPLNLPAIPRTG